MKSTDRLTILCVIVISTIAVQGSPQSRGPDGVKAPDPAWSALMGSMKQMHTGMMSIEPSGNNDVDFVRLMIPHHQAAINMAKVQVLCGKDPQIRRLAQEIITDQQSEIELMQLWLKQHETQQSGLQPSKDH